MAGMDPERLAEIDRAIEALGTPASQVRVEGGLDLAEVDRLLDDLAQGVELPPVPQGWGGDEAKEEPAAAAEEDAAEAAPQDDAAQDDAAAAAVEAPPTAASAEGLDADDLFGDVEGGEESAPLELESSELEPAQSGELTLDLEAALEGGDSPTDDEDAEEATGLFSPEDIEAIRRSSAPPPPDLDASAPVVAPLPSTPPPPPAEALASSRRAPQPAEDPLDVSVDEDLDALMEDDFELMIEDEIVEGESDVASDNEAGDEDDPTFIGSVADFQAQLAREEAEAETAEAEAAADGSEPGDTEENPIVDDGAGEPDGESGEGEGEGEKKGFFKKLFG